MEGALEGSARPLEASVPATTSPGMEPMLESPSVDSPAVRPQNPFDEFAATSPSTPVELPVVLTPQRPPRDAVMPTPPIVHSPATPLSASNAHSQPTTLLPIVPTMSTPEADDVSRSTDPSSTTNNNHKTTEVLTSNPLRSFLDQTRRRLSSYRPNDDEDDDLHGALIAGYLHKLGRNGKWQTRWFESDGNSLSYFKSQKRSQLLATLDLEKVRCRVASFVSLHSMLSVFLCWIVRQSVTHSLKPPQVGNIALDEADEKGCAFTIQVLGRDYHLRADTKDSCLDWVITLNRVKEAKAHQGNVKLVNEHLFQPDVAPRVVVVANRERTRAVDEPQDLDQLMREEDNSNTTMEPHKRISTIGTVVLARWNKRRSSISHLASKLAKWARSLRKYNCSDVETQEVQLDRHVHPPGHDNNDQWVGKEIAHAAAKPKPVDRSVSDTSDQEARYLS